LQLFAVVETSVLVPLFPQKEGKGNKIKQILSINRLTRIFLRYEILKAGIPGSP
jgi:hypothetical protein